MDREKVISKLEKEVQRTYSTKTTVFQNGKKVSEEINTHREPCVRIPIEMADKILALLKEQEAMIVRCKDCVSFCYNNPYIGTSASNAIRCPCNSINPDWFCADGVKKDA